MAKAKKIERAGGKKTKRNGATARSVSKKKKTKKKKSGPKPKYRPVFCKQLIDFFDREPYEEMKIDHYKGKGDNKEVTWTDTKRVANRTPTIRDFAKKIKVGTSTVYNWLNPKHGSYQEDFEDAFLVAKDLLKWFLIENGLNNCHNPIFAKFTAINMTDMRDKQDHDITGNIKINIVNYGDNPST